MLNQISFTIGIFILTALAGCGKQSDQSSSISLSFPESTNQSGYPIVQAIEVSDPFKFEENYNSENESSWGIPDPKNSREINCFALFVGGPGTEFNNNFCGFNGARTPISFGLAAGGFFSGTNTELSVPAGDGRNFYLIGFIAADSSQCYDFFANEMNQQTLSNPYLISSVQGVSLSPGETRTVEFLTKIEPQNRIGECRGPVFEENFPNEENPPTDPPPAGPEIAVHFGDGSDGNLNTSRIFDLSAEISPKGVPYISHHRITNVQPVPNSSEAIYSKILSESFAGKLSVDDKVMLYVHAMKTPVKTGLKNLATGQRFRLPGAWNYKGGKVVEMDGSFYYPVENDTADGALARSSISDSQAQADIINVCSGCGLDFPQRLTVIDNGAGAKKLFFWDHDGSGMSTAAYELSPGSNTPLKISIIPGFSGLRHASTYVEPGSPFKNISDDVFFYEFDGTNYVLVRYPAFGTPTTPNAMSASSLLPGQFKLREELTVTPGAVFFLHPVAGNMGLWVSTPANFDAGTATQVNTALFDTAAVDLKTLNFVEGSLFYEPGSELVLFRGQATWDDGTVSNTIIDVFYTPANSSHADFTKFGFYGPDLNLWDSNGDFAGFDFAKLIGGDLYFIADRPGASPAGLYKFPSVSSGIPAAAALLVAELDGFVSSDYFQFTKLGASDSFFITVETTAPGQADLLFFHDSSVPTTIQNTIPSDQQLIGKLYEGNGRVLFWTAQTGASSWLMQLQKLELGANLTSSFIEPSTIQQFSTVSATTRSPYIGEPFPGAPVAAQTAGGNTSACGQVYYGEFAFARVLSLEGANSERARLGLSNSRFRQFNNVALSRNGVVNSESDSFCHLQLVRVPQFENLSLSDGAILTTQGLGSVGNIGGSPSSGGILPVNVNGSLQVSGVATLDMHAKGFRGGVGTSSYPAEGFLGAFFSPQLKSLGTAGGFDTTDLCGGGGGHAFPGMGSGAAQGGRTSPSGFCSEGVPGECLFGNIYMGGGGGGAAVSSIPGGTGGGAIRLNARTIQLDSGGLLVLDGRGENASGNSNGTYLEVGGAGGGGAAIIRSESVINNGEIVLDVRGGLPASVATSSPCESFSTDGLAGAGGGGRAHLDVLFEYQGAAGVVPSDGFSAWQLDQAGTCQATGVAQVSCP